VIEIVNDATAVLVDSVMGELTDAAWSPPGRRPITPVRATTPETHAAPAESVPQGRDARASSTFTSASRAGAPRRDRAGWKVLAGSGAACRLAADGPAPAGHQDLKAIRAGTGG
jgi:hypothetical protein